jgi:hypothetical protein
MHTDDAHEARRAMNDMPQQALRGRIVGLPTAERQLLLGMVDRIVDEVSCVWRTDAGGWRVRPVLVQRRDGSELVVLRGGDMGTCCHERCRCWDMLEHIAWRISGELWQVTAVVPDVATAAPDVGARLTDDDTGPHLLSA